MVNEIDPATFAITEPGHWEDVASFLLIGDDRAAMIDTGTGIGDIAAVVKELTDRPVTVLTTHVHWDHIGGHNLFGDVRVHSADADWLRFGIGLSVEQMRSDLMREPLSRTPPESFDPQTWAPPTVSDPVILEDGEVFDLGARSVRAVHTPGHSPGHMCFHDDRGYLATGDLVYEGTPICAFYPSTDPASLASSIHRLAAIENVHMLLPGHNASVADPSLVREAQAAVHRLSADGKLHHGSGEHQFGRIRIKL